MIGRCKHWILNRKLSFSLCLSIPNQCISTSKIESINTSLDFSSSAVLSTMIFPHIDGSGSDHPSPCRWPSHKTQPDRSRLNKSSRPALFRFRSRTGRDLWASESCVVFSALLRLRSPDDLSYVGVGELYKFLGPNFGNLHRALAWEVPALLEWNHVVTVGKEKRCLNQLLP